MKALVCLALTACWTSKPPEPTPGSAVAAPTAPRPPANPKRCLPVVSKDCGCVYTCGIGEQRGDHWYVHHTFWKDSPLRAVIEPWCVDSQCTDAFAAEIVCDGICPRKPADSTCHFDATGACVGQPST